MTHHPTHMKDPREVAILALHATEKQGAWSDGVLKKMVNSLDGRDTALATRLCFGVLQNKGLIDFYLGHFSNTSLKRMEDLVVQILRVGVYQLLFMDKIPQNAAVNTAVDLAKKHSKNKKTSGMVNGILRNMARQVDELPEIPQDDPIEALSIRYSHPRWLVELFGQALPEAELPLLLEANNSQPPITAMINTVIATKKEVISSLEGENVTVKEHPFLEHCLILENTGNMERLSAFSEGLFYIQDPASFLAVEASGAKSGDRVLDTCAAPGGKSMALAIKMNNVGQVVSCDLHPHKKKLISSSAARLQLDCVTPETVNAKDFTDQWAEDFDLVFVDAPCSGLGVIGKKPDIRYKTPETLTQLPEIQGEILENVCQYVKSGGTLLYSTCTILKRENEDILMAFCQKHPEFSLESFTLSGDLGEISSGYLTLYPHRQGTDGFFMAKLRKK